MPPLRVHVLHAPEPDDLAILSERAGPGVVFTTGDVLPDPPEFEVLVAGRPDPGLLDASPRLRLLVVPYAGIPPETEELVRARPGLGLANLHHNAPATAEMALALLLAAAKCVLPMDRELRANRWSGRGRKNPGVLLDGETALVVGYGSIGRRVAAGCRALGMTVLATRRTERTVVDADGVEVHPAADLPALLPRARALLLTVPLTRETRGLVGAREFALLPAGAILVNVARGPVVEERALYDALRSGHLHSAGIDVWYRYPNRDGNPEETPPSALPFAELENVVMSPHRGGWLPGIEARRMTALGDLLAGFRARGS